MPTPVSFDLSGRTAVVVGGTTGIGRAIALGLADAGADVVVTGRRESVIDEVASQIEAKRRRTLRQAADVGDPASLASLRDACLKEFGQIDIVVCAAGTTKRLPSLDMTEADWRRIIDRNLNGLRRTCQPFAGPMTAATARRCV